MYALTNNVVQGKVRDAPANANVPLWIRKILLRGLRPTAASGIRRWASCWTRWERTRRRCAGRWRSPSRGAVLPVALVVGIRQSLADHRAVCGGGPGEAGRRLGAVGGRASPSRRGTRAIKNAFLHTGKSYAARRARDRQRAC